MQVNFQLRKSAKGLLKKWATYLRKIINLLLLIDLTIIWALYIKIDKSENETNRLAGQISIQFYGLSFNIVSILGI